MDNVQTMAAVGQAGFNAVVLASIAAIIDATDKANRLRPATDAGAGARAVRDAAIEALEAGAARVDIVPVIGASPFDGFLAENPAIGAAAAAQVMEELADLLDRSVAGAPVVFTGEAGPVTVGAALSAARRSAGDRPLAVLAPHQMRGFGSNQLRAMMTEYHRLDGGAVVVSAAAGMDHLPGIDWLARRGNRVFARNFREARQAGSEHSEMRLTGRCVLPPAGAPAGGARQGRLVATALTEVLNAELSAGRPVVAVSFARHSASTAAPAAERAMPRPTAEELLATLRAMTAPAGTGALA